MKTFIREQIEGDRSEVQDIAVAYHYYTPLFEDAAGVQITQQLLSYQGDRQGLMITKMTWAEAYVLATNLLAAIGERYKEPQKTKGSTIK